ncbi:MAG: hypothetical protein HYR59_07170 [Acidobacteria bacterium]|nr:hypothetical protein [Acidobacteriota bacterium]
MNVHLSEEQLTSMLVGDAETEGALAHVKACRDCRGEAERVRAALAGFAGSAQEEAERPEGFWAWQRDAILARVAQGTLRTRRLAWAGAMVLVILGAVWLTRPEQPAPRSPATISEWRSPTEGLLRGPADDFLRATPKIGDLYFPLDRTMQRRPKIKGGNNEN